MTSISGTNSARNVTKEDLEAILDSLVEGIVTLDCEGRIIGINRAACQILEVEKDEATLETFKQAIDDAWTTYRSLIGAGMPEEDARYVLPNAATTNITITMNARELLHFFRLSCCLRAQWEIRALANKMLEICTEKLPPVFEGGGAKCERVGYCSEGKFSCGRFPLKEEVISQEV